MSFYKRRWPGAILLGISYLALMWLSERYIPHPATLFPASAIALSALFLVGIELWPLVLVATVLGGFLAGFPLLFLILIPIGQTLQAVAGAYLMRLAKIDPLFRRSRDILFLVLIVFLVSLISPLFSSLAVVLATDFSHTSYLIAAFSLRYTGTVLCLLILTPFLLRWFAKPRFSRSWPEILETVAVFALLVVMDVLIFILYIPSVKGIPLVYFLLVPLFWIALRLRPRFVTLALLITTIFGILSLYTGSSLLVGAGFNLRLFQTEEFLIVLAMIFFIIVSIEEDRRLNSNLLRSQVATLENAVARITSESSAKNDFIAILAHELRNPLAPVLSSIEVLKMKERDQEESEMLVMMEGRMQIVQRLLDDLLDISRLTEGKISLKKERIDLEAIIKRAVISTSHYLKERHQLFTFKATKKPLFISGDPVRIEQIFSNLLTNASKYSDPGDQISLTIQKDGDRAKVIVSDTGMGIDPHAIQDIFTPFHQVAPAKQSKKGLGIGLALVRSFVEMHDGTVTAESAGAGRGSTFTVTFPLLPDDAGRPAQKPWTERVSSSALKEKSTGPRVLIVDDNDAAAWSMGKLLELKGCSVSYAYDGRQAVEQAINTSPDIILLDIGLPDQDGYMVAKTIRARGYHGRLIALTGYSTPDARTKGQESGFEYYLVKPAGFADLKRVIPEIA